jgi:hypothetical protein
MNDKIAAPETDLYVPLPGEGESWSPHTTHTHYFGFCVPEAAIGVFLYIRYMPHWPQCHGGVLVFQGTDNVLQTDLAFQDYQITMPWPEIDGNTFTTPNGLRFHFLEPGRRALITYASPDGDCSFEVEANAVTPLVARTHVTPGEASHTGSHSGGTEQLMHMTGTLVLRGRRHDVDCHYVRDRSWRQIRLERRDAHVHPPIIWTPMYFGQDFGLNQTGFESPDSDPLWAEAFDMPADAPTHHTGWVCRNGEVRHLKHVPVAVTESHPLLSIPLRIRLEIEDEVGDQYAATGEAIAITPMIMWPNVSCYDSVFRWEDGKGRVTHNTVQGLWSERAGHALKAKRRLQSLPTRG